MKQYREKRNWSLYNQKLKQIARVEFFISEEAIANWHYCGKRKSGGKIIYSDQAIELSLILKEYYKLAYRQTQGFMESVFNLMKIDVQTPDYTTMSILDINKNSNFLLQNKSYYLHIKNIT